MAAESIYVDEFQSSMVRPTTRTTAEIGRHVPVTRLLGGHRARRQRDHRQIIIDIRQSSGPVTTTMGPLVASLDAAQVPGDYGLSSLSADLRRSQTRGHWPSLPPAMLLLVAVAESARGQQRLVSGRSDGTPSFDFSIGLAYPVYSFAFDRQAMTSGGRAL